MKHNTRDDATGFDPGRMQFYTTEKLGPKRSFTPEGFLLCQEVPLARTGEMIYGPGETPIPPGPDGIVRIIREADEVFRPEYILSLSGKPVVNDHPPEDVNPENWVTYARGVTVNPRRGEGIQDDLLIADILVCEKSAIDDVLTGKVEVSVGYEAEYDELAPGRGRQYNLVGNHVALVDAGRCGPRCAIGDRKIPTLTGDCHMSKKTVDKLGWLAKLRAALRTKDQKAIDEAMEAAPEVLSGDAEGEVTDPEGGDTHVHVHAGEPSADTTVRDEEAHARLDALEASHNETRDMVSKIHDKLFPEEGEEGEEEEAAADAELEGELKEEAPEGTTDKAIKAKDSAFLGDSFQETMAMAEILVPGIKVPVFDAKANPRRTFDAICGLRRNALDQAYKTEDGKALINNLTGGRTPDLQKMPCRDLRVLFRGAAGAKKAFNSQQLSARDNVVSAGGGLGVTGKIKTPADLNKRMAEVYGDSATKH